MSEAYNFEDINDKPEIIKKNKERWRIELGNLAIEKCQLGINDSLTHLCDLIKNGDEALERIKQDAEADFSERLEKKEAYILNKLNFNFDYKNEDFISANDNVSMKSMTKNNLRTMKGIFSENSLYFMEVARAKAEIEEVNKLAKWFKDAPIDSNLIFESLPIGPTEKYAFTRIYQKKDDSTIEGCFVSLHNPSVDQFNNLRKELGADIENENEIDILQNCYQINEPELKATDDIMRFYVGIYDQILSEKNDRSYSFGIEKDKDTKTYNGLEKVKKATGKIDIYIDALKSVASSNGVATIELVFLNEKFGENKNAIKLNQKLSVKSIRKLLDDIIKSIASSIDKSSFKELNEHKTDKQSNYETVSYHGRVARENGETYDSKGCPTFIDSSTENGGTNTSDNNILSAIFSPFDKLKDFGQEHYGRCRFSEDGCPSGGRTVIVGGCSICPYCHLLLQKGENPKKIYKEKQQKQQEKEQSEVKKRQNQKNTETKKRLSYLIDDQKQAIKKAKDGNIYYIHKHKEISIKIEKLQKTN